MDAAQPKLTRVQKSIAFLLLAGFFFSLIYYLHLQTDLFQRFINNNYRTIPASEKTKYDVLVYCDIVDPTCGEVITILHNLQIEHSEEMRLTYSHFTDKYHSSADPANIALEIAGDDKKFWQMLLLLEQNRFEWTDATDKKHIFQEYAQLIDINGEKFIEKYDRGIKNNSKFIKRITKDTARAAKANVSTVPTVFINNELFTEAITYEMFDTKN